MTHDIRHTTKHRTWQFLCGDATYDTTRQWEIFYTHFAYTDWRLLSGSRLQTPARGFAYFHSTLRNIYR